MNEREQAVHGAELDLEAQTGVRLDDLQQQPGQQRVLQQSPDPQPHSPRVAASNQRGVSRQVFGRRHHPFGAFGDHFAHWRELRACRGAREDRQTQLVLDLGHAFRQGRLRNVQRLGRLGEAAVVADGQDLPEVTDVHGLPEGCRRDLPLIFVKASRLRPAFP